MGFPSACISSSTVCLSYKTSHGPSSSHGFLSPHSFTDLGGRCLLFHSFSSLSLRKSNQIHGMPRLSASQNKLVSTRKNKASAVCLKSSNIGLICRQSALLDCYSIRDKVFYRSNKFFFFSLMATFRMIRSMWHWKDSD